MSSERRTLARRLRDQAGRILASPERRMALLSLLVSLVALGLMLAGFAILMGGGQSYHLPGERALALHDIVHPLRSAAPVDVMSIGIVLLLLLPVIRIMIAVIPFARRRQWFDAAVTAVVFLELLFSILSGK